MIWQAYREQLRHQDFYVRSGVLTKASGLVIEAAGIGGHIGEVCRITDRKTSRHFNAEIVGLNENSTLLMPHGEMHGISLDSDITATGESVQVNVGNDLIGRVIDPFGHPLDGGDKIKLPEKVPLRGAHRNPLARKKITRQIETGVRAIDVFLPIGRGQRVGIFSGSGVGKSTLLGMIAKHTDSDVNVIALIGERGREVGDFLTNVLGEDGLSKSIVVVATSDQPPLVRELAAHTATAIAEYFAGMNQDVLLMMDSVTRFAMAQREIGLSIGEPATARGYTPSAFAALPKLIERAGNFHNSGSITGIYTVLVEGDDLHEPVSDHMRAILDGHIVLSRDLANHGHYPAIDLLASASRLASEIWSKRERESVANLLRLLSVRERHRDMIDIGAYRAGSNPELDRAIESYPRIEGFLTQGADDVSDRMTSYQSLNQLLGVGN